MANPFHNFDKDAFQQKIKDRMSDSVQNARTSTALIGPLQWLAIIVCVLGVALCVGSLLNMTREQDNYVLMYESNVSEISRLNAELTNYQNASVPTAEELHVSVVSAYEKGARVAFLQNAYFDIDASSQEAAWRENLVALAAYFDENTIRGQEQWFRPTNLYAYTELMWQFASDVSSAAEVFPVVWLCYDENDRLVAYALGQYHSDTELFSNVEVVVTSYGRASYVVQTDEGFIDPSSDDSYVEYNPIEIPDGYHLEVNEDGSTTIVEDNGNVYQDDVVTDIIDGGQFAEDFQEAINDRVESLEPRGGASE